MRSKTASFVPAKNITRLIAGTAIILLVPLVAMLFTDGVDWDITDFVVMGVLLLGAGLTFELIMTKVRAKYRPVVAAAIILAVLLIWAELAVGVFGTPLAGN